MHSSNPPLLYAVYVPEYIILQITWGKEYLTTKLQYALGPADECQCSLQAFLSQHVVRDSLNGHFRNFPERAFTTK